MLCLSVCLLPMQKSTDAIRVDWKTLVEIEYELRYFKSIKEEIYAPLFTKEIQALNGKEVVIEGYVIPLDEDTGLVALSANPYASCFFCGKASPASILSLYLKKNNNRYKIDDYRSFKGTLYLNDDDPNEFYYILRDAEEANRY